MAADRRDTTETEREGGDEQPRATTSGRSKPPELLTPEPMWALWDGVEKVPLAPWLTGHCYRASWGAHLEGDDRPETTYDEANMYATLPPRELHRTHAFPTTDDNGHPIDDPIPERVIPTILLPPEGRGTPVSSRVMYIDLDDVRDPETREITHEAAWIIERLASYTEVSRSRTGLHIIVIGHLPDGVPVVDGDDLDEAGSIEMYDHGRFFGGTWRHVDGTPTDVHERQEAVNELFERYSSHRLEAPETGAGSSDGSSASSSAGGSGDRSPYYDVDTAAFAEPNPIEVSPRGHTQGAHPHHGKTTGGDTSRNYNLKDDGRWHCFAHNSGGGTMEMAAVMAGEIECPDAGAGCLNRLDDAALLRVCIYARDTLNGFADDMKPPYRALVATARHFDVTLADEEEDILGRVAHVVATKLYDELTVADLD